MFNHHYSFGIFNFQYQLWLVLKQGLEPTVEWEDLEWVLVSYTPKKIAKNMKMGGQMVHQGMNNSV